MRLLPLLAAVLLGLAARSAAAQADVRAIVPIYSYPCPTGTACTYPCDGQTCTDQGFSFWTDMLRAIQRGVGVVGIVNVNSGPDTATDPQYSFAIDSLVRAGVTPVGYVSTDYGARSRADIEADIRGWSTLYPNRITGIFFDEVSPSAHPDTVAFYNELCAFATTQPVVNLTILNPGAIPEEGWRTTCNVVIPYENAYAAPDNPWATHVLPDSIRSMGAHRLGAIIHTTPEAAMPEVLAQAVQRGYGFVYVTDDSTEGLPPSPYNFLPTYWDAEIGVIRGLITAAEATPATAGAITLSAARPSPARGSVRFTLTAAAVTRVRVEAFDALGRRVAVLLDGPVAPGAGVPVVFDGTGLPDGVYVVRATSDAGTATQRVTLAH